MTYLSKVQLLNIVYANASLFVIGSNIPNSWLCETFNIEQPTLDVSNYEQTAAAINKFNLRRAYWYTRLNNCISKFGLVIRQHTNRHTKEVTFVVQQKEGVFKRLEAYATTRDIKLVQYRELKLGFSRHKGQLPARISAEIPRQGTLL